MLTPKALDKILDDLSRKRQYKKDIQIAKAKAELDAINRETDAYYDGVYDAIKAVKELLPESHQKDT